VRAIKYWYGAVQKGICSRQGKGEGVVQCRQGGRGSSDTSVRTFWGNKHLWMAPNENVIIV